MNTGSLQRQSEQPKDKIRQTENPNLFVLIDLHDSDSDDSGSETDNDCSEQLDQSPSPPNSTSPRENSEFPTQAVRKINLKKPFTYEARTNSIDSTDDTE